MPSYLRKIGRVYYLRIAVPTNLQSVANLKYKKEILKSLRTTNIREAKQKATLLAAKYLEEFKRMENKSTRESDISNLHTILKAKDELIASQQAKIASLLKALENKTPTPCTTVEEAFDKFVVAAGHSNKWKNHDRIKQRYKREVDYFLSITKVSLLSEITQEHLDTYAVSLKDYPADWKEGTRTTFEDYVTNTPRYKRISPQHQKDKYQILLGFLKWCRRKIKVEMDKDIDLTPLEITIRKKDKEGYGRHAFTINQVAAILTHPTWSKASFDFDWKYWLCLLSIYTAGRPTELAQASKFDFRKSGEHLIFKIDENWSGQSVKNENSFREIIIHPELAKGLNFEGFLELSNFSLFPDLWTKSKTVRLDKHQNFFHKEVMPQTIGKSSQQSFYSIRHFVENHAQACGMDGDKVDMLMGHGNKNGNRAQMSGVYGDSDKLYAWQKQFLEKYTCKDILEEAGVKPWAKTRRLKSGKRHHLF